MQKDFNKWNEIKKSIDEKSDNLGLYVHEREIWWASLGLNIGVEIDGKHKSFERPVLVLKKFNRQMVWILPTTSRCGDKKFYERYVFNDKEYFVVLTQPRTVSTKRFIRKIGMMPKNDFEKIKQLLIKFLHK